jgi:hypothetical protein
MCPSLARPPSGAAPPLAAAPDGGRAADAAQPPPPEESQWHSVKRVVRREPVASIGETVGGICA